MKTATLTRLLNKKKPTGADVGKLLIASAIHDAKHQSEPDFKPLFSPSDFEQMENSLTTDRDYTVYGVYRDLYSAIIDAYNRGQGLFQQFYNGYSRYSHSMYLCQQADEALKRLESYPLIMTQSQYNRHKERAERRLKSLQESFSTLLFHVLEKFIESPEEAPNNIRELIEATKEESATNHRILGAYNKDYGHGYYQLPDGRRSDTMSIEEWQNALQEFSTNGDPATAEDTYRHYSEQRLLKAYRLFYTGIDGIKSLYKKATGKEMDEMDVADESQLMETLEDMLGGSLNIREEQKRIEKAQAPLYPLYRLLNWLIDGTTENAIEWHYYEKFPELTKYDLLTDCLERYSGIANDDVDAKTQFKEFMTDFPALFSAMEAHIKEAVPALQGLKPAQYHKCAISWGELADLDIIGYKKLTEADEWQLLEELQKDKNNNYTKNRRCFRKGIAIIQNPREWQIDENGDYIEIADPIAAFTNLDSIAEDTQKQTELFAFQNNLFKPALRFMYAFNALMKIIGIVYGLEDMEDLQLLTKTLESQLASFNNLIYIFYADVYGDQPEKERKRAIIKKFFLPVDIEELKPTKDAIDAVTNELKDLGYTVKARKNLKNFDHYMSLLMGEGA